MFDCRAPHNLLANTSLFWFREASVHDLTGFKEQEIALQSATMFADKVCDAALEKQLKEQNTQMFVPPKKQKGEIANFTFKRLAL